MPSQLTQLTQLIQCTQSIYAWLRVQAPGCLAALVRVYAPVHAQAHAPGAPLIGYCTLYVLIFFYPPWGYQEGCYSIQEGRASFEVKVGTPKHNFSVI